MGCGNTCLKIVLITINTIFFLAGAGILGVGLWIRFDERIEKFEGSAGGLEEFRTSLHTAAYILIAFGAFTFFVGFCGCFGAIKKSKCLLGVYIFLVVIILAAEIAGGVFAYVKKDELEKQFSSIASNYVRNKYNDSKNADDSGWNFVMLLLDCCGVDGYKDFINSTYERNSGNSVPAACCVQKSNESGEKIAPQNYQACKLEARAEEPKSQLQKEGCKQKIIDFISENSTILLGVAAGVAGFELLVIIAAVVFCCSIDSDD